MSGLPRRYCIFGCDALVAYGVPLHRFPNPDKNPDLFSAWMVAVGSKFRERDRTKIFKNKKVCDHHFDPTFKTTGGRLICTAIPTVNLNRVLQTVSTFADTDHSYSRPRREFGLAGPRTDMTKFLRPSVSHHLPGAPGPSDAVDSTEFSEPSAGAKNGNPTNHDSCEESATQELGADEELDSDSRSADDDIVPPSEPHTLHLHTARICRVCLAVDVKMFPLRDSELTIMFHTITGIQLEDNEGGNVGSLICWECAARLRAASTFRSKALLSDTLLQRLINKGEAIENNYFETVKEEADRLISPKNLTATEIIHIVDIEDQNNTSQLVQSGDDDQHSISDKISDTQESKIDENILMDVEEDANVAITTEIEDHPTYCNTEDENITKIINDEIPQLVEETGDFGSSILLDIGHTDLTCAQDDCENQINKKLTEPKIVLTQNIELKNTNKRPRIVLTNDLMEDNEGEKKKKKLKTYGATSKKVSSKKPARDTQFF